MSTKDVLSSLMSPEAIEAAADSALAVDAINALASENSSTLSVIGAIGTLTATAFDSDSPAGMRLGTASAVMSFAGLFEQISDGEFTADDVASATAAIGAALSRVKHPAFQAAGSFFSVYSLLVPSLVEFGESLGSDLYRKGENLGTALPWFLTNFDLPELVGYLSDDIHSMFEDAKSVTRPWRFDPLALDLDGDGIETTPIGNWQSTTLFDHDGDGVATGTGWLGPDDGWLVRDLDGNGRIESGAELFGDNTRLSDGSIAADGFSALADLDSNQDGYLDDADNAFAELMVWRDLNQDGQSQATELASLTEMGIASIDLCATADGEVNNGNMVTAKSSFTRTDGTQSQIGNLELTASAFFTEFEQENALSNELPDVHGSGAVRNLRDAAGRSAPLAALLADYAQSDRRAQQAGLDELITSWASSSTMQAMIERAKSNGFIVLYEVNNGPSLTDMEAVGAVEGFIASATESDANQADYSQVFADAMGPENGADYLELSRIIGVLERFNGQEFVSFDRPTAANPVIGAGSVARADEGGGRPDTYEIVRVRLQLEQVELLQQAYQSLESSVSDALLVQTHLQDYVSDIAIGFENEAIALDFSALNTKLEQAFAMDDTEAAHDLLDLDRFFGDQLNEWGWRPERFMAERIASSPIVLSRPALDALSGLGFGVLPGIAGGQLSANIEQPDLFGRSGADRLLGDGTENRLFGGGGDDHLVGYGGADHIEGGEGNDLLEGGDGADVLDGGSGNDTLTTHYNHGGNHLRGGAGDDQITGSYRDDTYYYRAGDGRDVIRDTYCYSGTDRLVLEDLSPENVQATREGTSLVLNMLADDGQVKIEDWYQTDHARIEQVVFADGTAWDVDALHHAGLAVYGSDTRDTMYGLDTQADRLHGNGGDDVLYGRDGDDRLFGGAGDDLLDGGYGSNTLDGGAGNDTLTTFYNHGGNHLRGGAGNDSITGSYRDDTYYYRAGDGRDVIRDAYRYSGTDRLVLEDLSPNDVQATREGTSLVLNMLADDGQVKVEDWYQTDHARIEQVIFADGTVWDIDATHDAGLAVFGSEVGETIHGLDTQADRLHGGGGDDLLYGWNGNDSLFGGAGNDRLEGGQGANVLDGGAGDDTLTTFYKHGGNHFRGGTGNDLMIGSFRDDTYYYRSGDGRDLIRDNYRYSGTDRLVFEDISHDQLWFERSGNDLTISTLTDTGTITVEGWYVGAMQQIEQFSTADGLAASNTSLEQLVSAMAAFGRPEGGESGAMAPMPEELQPALAAAWQAT